MIKRGTRTIQRSGRNKLFKQAQARLEESVKPFNDQVENSIKVDGVEVEYYQIRNKVGTPCTCRAKPALQQIKGVEEGDDYELDHSNTTSESTDTFNVKFQDDEIFGSDLSDKILNGGFDDDLPNKGDRAFEVSSKGEYLEDGEDYSETGTGNNVKCGICYRTGMLPGYHAINKNRFLFTTLNYVNLNDTMVNDLEKPSRFEWQFEGHKGYVSFVVNVPKYWKSCTISIRNNEDILHRDRIKRIDGVDITGDYMRQFNGGEMEFFVFSPEFTHVTVEFSMNIEPVYANISGMQSSMDYETFRTMSNISATLPPSLKDVESGDIMIVPKKNLTLKIIDRERKDTSNNRRLEWSVTTRVLQPYDVLRHINKGYKLF